MSEETRNTQEQIAAMRGSAEKKEKQESDIKSQLVREIADMVEGNRRLSEKGDFESRGWGYEKTEAEERKKLEDEIAERRIVIKQERTTLEEQKTAVADFESQFGETENSRNIKIEIQAAERDLQERTQKLEIDEANIEKTIEELKTKHSIFKEKQNEIAQNDIKFALESVLNAHHETESQDYSKYREELTQITIEELKRRETKRKQEDFIAKIEPGIIEAEKIIQEARNDLEQLKQKINKAFNEIEEELQDEAPQVNKLKDKWANKQDARIFKGKAQREAEDIKEQLKARKQEFYSQIVNLANEVLEFSWRQRSGSNKTIGNIVSFGLHLYRFSTFSTEPDLTGKGEGLNMRIDESEKNARELTSQIHDYRAETQKRMGKIETDLKRVFDIKN